MLPPGPGPQPHSDLGTVPSYRTEYQPSQLVTVSDQKCEINKNVAVRLWILVFLPSPIKILHESIASPWDPLASIYSNRGLAPANLGWKAQGVG